MPAKRRGRCNSGVLGTAGILVVVLVMVTVVLLTGSASSIARPPAAVIGDTGSPSDTLASSVVAAVEGYWRDQFPVRFGRRWSNIHAFTAIDPADAAVRVPCASRSTGLSRQALYCPQSDAVIWDRTTLLPDLRARYGDGAVLVALAHEIGHAVQHRLGFDADRQGDEPTPYPTVVLETMADCFAGVVMHAAADGQLAGVRISRAELDQSLRALLSLRDPISLANLTATHGDAFDRASAFVDGYQNGATTCAGMTGENQMITQRAYHSLAEAVHGGDLPLPRALASLVPDATAWYGALVTLRGGSWRTPPNSVLTDPGCPASDLSRQGPARFCSSSGAVTVAAEDLAAVVRDHGDYAGAELVASRYALAALAALGRPVHGPTAGRAAVCLTGAYTRALFKRIDTTRLALSPGDIDEAIEELLDHDFAARDASGSAPAGDLGFERVGQFRTGALGGPAACGV